MQDILSQIVQTAQPGAVYLQYIDNEETVCQMFTEQWGMRVPSDLVPHCPVYGKLVTMNLQVDDTFVQDEGGYQAQGRYQKFLRRYDWMRVVFLELGVGGNTLVIIKYQFWKYTLDTPNAFYACINSQDAFAPTEIANRSVCVENDMGEFLEKVC